MGSVTCAGSGVVGSVGSVGSVGVVGVVGAAQPLIKGIDMAITAAKLTPTISFSKFCLFNETLLIFVSYIS